VGVRGNVRSSPSSLESALIDFIFAVIEHFSVALTVETLYADIG